MSSSLPAGGVRTSGLWRILASLVRASAVGNGMQAELFGQVEVKSHNRRRPRQRQAEQRLLLADALALLSRIGAPRREDTARQFYGVRRRLREAVRQ